MGKGLSASRDELMMWAIRKGLDFSEDRDKIEKERIRREKISETKNNKKDKTKDNKKDKTKYGVNPVHAQKEEKKDQEIRKKLGSNYERVKQELNDIIKNSEFGTYRSLRSAIDIINSHFKSLVETGTSSGSSYTPARIDNENEWFGTAKDSSPEKFAKYGMLVSSDLVKAMNESPHYGAYSGGGQVLVTFKKDEVFGNVTLTTSDSLDHKSTGFIPSTITKDGVASLAGIAERDIARFSLSRDRDGTDYYARRGSDHYLEVQFHGNYGAKQIDKIVLGSPSQTIPKSIVSKLESYGGKVYRTDGKKLILYRGD